MESRKQSSTGALDPTFGAAGVFFLTTDVLNGVVAQRVTTMPDGRLMVAGYKRRPEGQTGFDFALVCLTESGEPDTSFGTFAPGLTLGSFSPDPASSSEAGFIARTPDDKLIVSGIVFSRGAITPALAKFHADGTLDESFGDGSGQVNFTFPPPQGPMSRAPVPEDGSRVVSPNENEYIALEAATFSFHVTPLASGKLIISGAIKDGRQENYYSVLARLDERGMLDPTFGAGGYRYVGGRGSTADSHVILPDGSIMVCGHERKISGFTRAYVGKFTANGLHDDAYGSEGGFAFPILFGGTGENTAAGANSMVLHGDNKVVVAANEFVNGWLSMLGALDKNGMSDPGFNNGFPVRLPQFEGSWMIISDSLYDGDGFILCGQANRTLMLTRYFFDGTMDTRFGDGGWWRHFPSRFVGSMARQPDGKFLGMGLYPTGGFGGMEYVARFLGS
ncbi:MAG: hypothetical protein ACTHOL_14470 [Luteibacter jiangsuensis]